MKSQPGSKKNSLGARLESELREIRWNKEGGTKL